MRQIRVFTPQPLSTGQTIELESDAAHHLAQVLRLKAGAQINLFNGDGHEYQARLLESGKRRARLQLLACITSEAPPSLSIHLGLGLSRGERMDFAVQKSVELGVSVITPLLTEFCSVRLSPQRRDSRRRHWHRITVSACEQSGRCRLPRLDEITGLEHWLKTVPTQSAIMLDHRSPLSFDQLPQPKNRVSLLIGPEGGLSEKERAMAEHSGFTAARLGPRVLRTETAPLAAIAAAQMLWGDFASAGAAATGS